MLMVARHRLVNVKMIQELQRVACILRRNQIDILQCLQHPKRNILQIPDRRRTKVQRPLACILIVLIHHSSSPASFADGVQNLSVSIRKYRRSHPYTFLAPGIQ